MKTNLLLLALILSGAFCKAQTDKTYPTAFIINGSYSYLPAEKKLLGGSTLSNQRNGYLQAAFVASLSSKNIVGLHAGWQENSFDSKTIGPSVNLLHLERTRQFDIGFIYRRQRRFIVDKMLLFLQGTADVSFATQRLQTENGSFNKEGDGFRFQVRPGIDYMISKSTSLEAGFGVIDTQFMRWTDLPGASGFVSNFNLNTTFNLSSVYLGLKMAF